jgi:hypothetical protein
MYPLVVARQQLGKHYPKTKCESLEAAFSMRSVTYKSTVIDQFFLESLDIHSTKCFYQCYQLHVLYMNLVYSRY